MCDESIHARAFDWVVRRTDKDDLVLKEEESGFVTNRMSARNLSEHAGECQFVYTSVCACTHACMHVCVCVCVRARAFVCMCISGL